MPFEHQFDSTRGLVTVVLHGTCSVAEIVADMHLLRASPRFHEDLCLLIDFRRCTTLPSPNEARQIAEMAASPALFLKNRTAIVADESAAYGTANITAAYANLSGGNVKRFRTIAQAEVWLSPSSDQVKGNDAFN